MGAFRVRLLFWLLVFSYAVAQDSASGEIEEVVITGSYIKGTGTDEASPVEVLNNDYIQKSGAITVAELTHRSQHRCIYFG